MKKEYITPELELEEIETEDIMSTSGTVNVKKPGDSSVKWPWKN